MTRKAIWRRLAEQDLTEACVYLGTRSPASAERLLDAVEETVRLLENPLAGRRREFHSAQARVSAPGPCAAYLVFYRAAGEAIEVIRLLHGARDIPRLFEEE